MAEETQRTEIAKGTHDQLSPAGDGRREKAAHEKTSQDWCDEFEREYKANSRGRVVWENPDNTLTHLRAYSFNLPTPQTADTERLNRDAVGVNYCFGSLAAQAG